MARVTMTETELARKLADQRSEDYRVCAESVRRLAGCVDIQGKSPDEVVDYVAGQLEGMAAFKPVSL